VLEAADRSLAAGGGRVVLEPEPARAVPAPKRRRARVLVPAIVRATA
jgi:hypothetical protein